MDYQSANAYQKQFMQIFGTPRNVSPILPPHLRRGVVEEPMNIPTNMASIHQKRNQTLMQMNGRKVLTPPENWLGAPPTSACELFVRRIPKSLDAQELIQPFLRFGEIYEFRMPIDFNFCNRGYAYVKYTNEDDAASAMEVLNHYYVAPQRKMEVMHSYEKCQLFVNNIPKNISEAEVEQNLRRVFPNMQRIYTRCSYPSTHAFHQYNSHYAGAFPAFLNNIGNRGHAFIHFASHTHALEAKKRTTPGLIRMWGRDLKVVWAHTYRDHDASKSTKTLFVRNVDLSVNNRDIIDMLVKHVPRTTIRKISKVRTTAFFDFTTREAAETCLNQLQGAILHGHCLDLEWAKPSEQQSLHRMRNTDFDAVLRLKCLANGWMLPVVLFGTYYEREGLQYGAVTLRDAKGVMRASYLIMQPHELVDIHSRMCEVICLLIETIGGFPDCNYVFSVQGDSAHLVGMIKNTNNLLEFIASAGIPRDMYFDLNEILDLTWAVSLLASASEDALLAAYQESFRANTICTFLQGWVTMTNRIFGTIMPKYRNKPALRYNLNDTQIVMALCFVSTGTNRVLPTRPYSPLTISIFNNGYEGLPYASLKMLPIALTQSRFTENHNLSCVQFGTADYYHPAQRVMIPPLWISCISYETTIKQLTPQQERANCLKRQQQLHALKTPTSTANRVVTATQSSIMKTINSGAPTYSTATIH